MNRHYRMKRLYPNMYRLALGHENVGWVRRVGGVWVAMDAHVRVEAATPEAVFDAFVKAANGSKAARAPKETSHVIFTPRARPTPLQLMTDEEVFSLCGPIRFNLRRKQRRA